MFIFFWFERNDLLRTLNWFKGKLNPFIQLLSEEIITETSLRELNSSSAMEKNKEYLQSFGEVVT